MKKRILCVAACCCLLFGCSKTAKQTPDTDLTTETAVQTQQNPTLPEETQLQEMVVCGETIEETQPQQTQSQTEADQEPEVCPTEPKPDAGKGNTTVSNPNTTTGTPPKTTENTTTNTTPSTPPNSIPSTPPSSTPGTAPNTTPGNTNSNPGTATESTGSSGSNVPSSYTPPTYPSETDNEVLMFRYDTMTIPFGSSKTAELFYFGNGTLRWYCLQPSLVQISNEGRITPLWDGNFIIYVTDGTYTDSIYVKVPKEDTDAEPSLYFENSSIELYAGQTIPLKVKGSAVTHYNTITYTSSEFTVASIYSRNELKGHNPGTTIITAECAGHRATMVVKVVPAPPKGPELMLTHSSLNLRVSGEFQLHPIYTGNGTLQWISMNPDIVKVENNGLVTAVGAGVGKFYVTDGDLIVYCEVNVR